MVRRFRLSLIGALLLAASVGACVEEETGGPAALASDGDCKSIKARMDRLVAQGKANGNEYSDLLNRYASKSCY